MWRVIDLASENEVKTQKDSVLPSAYQHGDASLLYEGKKKKGWFSTLYPVQPFSSAFFCFGDAVEVEEVPGWARRGRASSFFYTRVTAGAF